MAESVGFVQNSRSLHPELYAGGVLSGQAVPVRLPHYHLWENSLFFLTSQKAYAGLDAREWELWEAIDGCQNVAELRERFGPEVDQVINRFIDLLVCELLPGEFPVGRRRIVVIEPHMDDAVLSVGGIMWLRREECEFIVVTLAGVTNFTTQLVIGRDFFDPQTVSRLRQDESAICVRHLGARHQALGLLEAPLRYSSEPWTLQWYKAHKKAVGAFVNHTAGPVEHEAWAAQIKKTILEQKPDELWLPLGLGYHVDHELTRNAFLWLATTSPTLLAGIDVTLYQDVPYAAIAPEHTADLLQTLNGAGAVLEEQKVDISPVMDQKLQLLTLFRSQFKIDPIRLKVEACGRQAAQGPGRFSEVIYRVRSLPTRAIDQVSTLAINRSVNRLGRDLAPWIKRNHAAPVIRILVAVGVGRWAEDIQYLLDSFPHTQFELHVPGDCLIETLSLSSPRIVTVPIDNKWKNWLSNAVRTVLCRPGPIVLISGADDDKQKKIADALSAVSIGSDSLVALTMNQFILALRKVRSAAGSV